MHTHAYHAIRAAKNYGTWGAYATMRYLKLRSVPMGLFTLARVLEAAKRAGLN
jgi:hypothetical protein